MKSSRIVMSLVGLVAILLVNFAAIFYDVGPKVAYGCNCWYEKEYCHNPTIGRDYCASNYASQCDRCLCGYQ